MNIPEGFEEWTFSNNPQDGEEVEIIRYGKIEKAKYDSKHMAFIVCGITRQERIIHFRRIK